MNLKIQVFSFLFSFIYGVILFFLFKSQYRLLFSRNRKRKVIYNGVFCIGISIIYFILMYFINNGIVHLYFLLLIVFGFLLTHNFFNKIM